MVAGQRRGREEMLADVRAAVLAELDEVGLGRLSMAGIAARSGTARTSLHRHWETPADVLLDALAHDYPQETVSPGADDLRADLVAALALLADWLATPAARAVAALMDERERRPEIVEALFERVFDPRGARFTRTVLAHYAEQGRIDPARVTDVVVEIGEALVLKSLADTGRIPDRERLERIVDEAVLPAVGAQCERFSGR